MLNMTYHITAFFPCHPLSCENVYFFIEPDENNQDFMVNDRCFGYNLDKILLK